MKINEFIEKVKVHDVVDLVVEEKSDENETYFLIEDRITLVPSTQDEEVKGITVFVPTTHTADPDLLDNAAAQTIYTIKTLALFVVLVEVMTGRDSDDSLRALNAVGLGDSGLVRHKKKAMYVLGDFNITRTSQEGLILFTISHKITN